MRRAQRRSAPAAQRRTMLRVDRSGMHERRAGRARRRATLRIESTLVMMRPRICCNAAASRNGPTNTIGGRAGTRARDAAEVAIPRAQATLGEPRVSPRAAGHSAARRCGAQRRSQHRLEQHAEGGIRHRGLAGREQRIRAFGVARFVGGARLVERRRQRGRPGARRRASPPAWRPRAARSPKARRSTPCIAVRRRTDTLPCATGARRRWSGAWRRDSVARGRRAWPRPTRPRCRGGRRVASAARASARPGRGPVRHFRRVRASRGIPRRSG